ncbi:MAG: DNA-3-methyladenine glycosylase [Polyangiales bacterium]
MLTPLDDDPLTRFGPALERPFFARSADVVARALLGCALVRSDGETTRVGRIVETEAYVGEHDLACHASKGVTSRTRVMFGEAGHAYVYLIYGMHSCFNVVTDAIGVGSAVLVRALAPIAGCDGATDGPGRLTRALRIDRLHDGIDLCAPAAMLRLHARPRARVGRIDCGPRIGVDYAGSWAAAPLRFWISDEPWVSGVPAALRKLRRSAT